MGRCRPQQWAARICETRRPSSLVTPRTFARPVHLRLRCLQSSAPTSQNAVPTTSPAKFISWAVCGTAFCACLGTAGSAAAYRYLQQATPTDKDGIAQESHGSVGKTAPVPLSNSEPGPPGLWSVVVGIGFVFTGGIAAGATFGLRDIYKRKNEVFQTEAVAGNVAKAEVAKAEVAATIDPAVQAALRREGMMLGLRAFAVATALVGAFGCAVVLTTRGALGITTFREFGNVMRGRPKYEIPVLDEADDNWLDALEAEHTEHAVLALRLSGRDGLHVVVDIFNQQAGDSCAAKTIVVVHDSMPGADRISALEALGSGLPHLTEREGYAIMLYDQRGHGQSTTATQRQGQLWGWLFPSDSPSLQKSGLTAQEATDRAEDLVATLDELELSGAHLVAIGDGGCRVATTFLRLHRDRGISLSLLAGTSSEDRVPLLSIVSRPGAPDIAVEIRRFLDGIELNPTLGTG